MPETTGRPDLRDAQADDLPFLFNLYCDVRGPEISAWGWLAAQCDAFLRMQFEAQRRSYEASFPGSSNQIVLRDGQAIGRCLTARTGEEILLVDIALLAAHRNRGVGTWLMQQLLRECRTTGSALSLQVLRGNPAQRLYQRLGFIETGADDMYIQMAWKPGSSPSA